MTKHRIFTFAAAALFAAGASAAAAPLVTDPGPAPASILIVGNSYMYYNCGINSYLGGMIREKANPKVKTRIAAIGRGNLSQYPIAEYLDNTRLRSHEKKWGALDAKLLEAEEKKRESYEAVLMQASNRGRNDQARDAHYMKAHADAIRSSGARPALILTWVQNRANAPKFETVLEAVTRTGNENGMLVIPVGPAFNTARAELPDVAFLMPDNTHPTAAGSYLMGSVIYASLYKRDPMDAAGFEGGCEKPLPQELRKKLHAIAWKTVKSWYGW